jgi:hypothetical protein
MVVVGTKTSPVRRRRSEREGVWRTRALIQSRLESKLGIIGSAIFSEARGVTYIYLRASHTHWCASILLVSISGSVVTNGLVNVCYSTKPLLQTSQPTRLALFTATLTSVAISCPAAIGDIVVFVIHRCNSSGSLSSQSLSLSSQHAVGAVIAAASLYITVLARWNNPPPGPL